MIEQPIRLRHHLKFIVSSGIFLLIVCALLRLALLVYNRELIGQTAAWDIAEAFVNGLRFDLRLEVYALAPLLIAILIPPFMRSRRWQKIWLCFFVSVTFFLGIIELDFYREFHQRLNSLVFEYFGEDPTTVTSMLWYGYPVVRYLLAWVIGSWLAFKIISKLDKWCRPADVEQSTEVNKEDKEVASWLLTGFVFTVCLLLAVVAFRGTLRQGAPLRWGDASTTSSVFANHLGLNGTLTLIDAARALTSSQRDNIWTSKLPKDKALNEVRHMLLMPNEKLIDAVDAPIRRITTPDENKTLPIHNVVVILMESFSGHYVGAMGAKGKITPYFDKLSEQGLLFTRYFSNGTHTHQGMFATMACFPNLPGFEYLMQQPEGTHQFSGLPQLLSHRGFNNLYVYNGDFGWDNQKGFFGNQGMTKFIGRNDYVNPIFSDPTWGVSDQDMFNRADQELSKMPKDKPFYALLQTLSNHTPYAIPDPLPVDKVTGYGSLNEHLTSMRYADWALGQFFKKAQKEPYYKNTMFVLVGDHGFGNPQQLTDIDLYRFHVPMLIIAPGLQEKFGKRNDVVGTQVDIVPTIMGRLGGSFQQQCWGRDLLNLPEDDLGFGVIKPSGNDQTVAIVSGKQILVKPKNQAAILYDYRLHKNLGANPVDKPEKVKELQLQLGSFLETATRSLLGNSTGVTGKKDALK